MTSQLPYRPGVGIMLIHPDKRVFVAKRLDMTSEAWQMPQGGIDEGELPLEAAKRELKEEIGTDKIAFLRESRDWLTYDLPERLIPLLWNGRFRGQRQKWFALRFLGTDADINILTEEPEFSEWKWVEARLLAELIVPFKRKMYEDLVAEFGDLF